MTHKENPGVNKLANILSARMKKENDSSLVLDFGRIQENGSLLTNTFPCPIPTEDYSICRQLTLGGVGERLAEITGSGEHDGHSDGDGTHGHIIEIPEKMRSIRPGDRVLVAWVQNEAVVIDIVET